MLEDASNDCASFCSHCDGMLEFGGPNAIAHNVFCTLGVMLLARILSVGVNCEDFVSSPHRDFNMVQSSMSQNVMIVLNLCGGRMWLLRPLFPAER